MKFIKSYWHRISLFLIMVLTGFLTFFDIGKEGYANTYYTACVKSMLTSFKNFFFVSLDPGGFVSVDKPALGLWLQALSAKIFGFHGWSVILVEAFSTVVSVAVLYHIVQRFFGKSAGLLSALALSLTPILVAVSRTNNLDASLVMTVLLGAWALIVAAERGSLKHLVLAMVLVGLGFNIKMLEAFMVLPAFYIVYFFASNIKMKKRIIHLGISTSILIVVALSWAIVVDMTPADKRPYVGSSQTNSVLELALGYNGIDRVTGRENGMGRGNWQGSIESILQRNDGQRDMQFSQNGMGQQRGNMMPQNGNMPNGNPQNRAWGPQGANMRGNFPFGDFDRRQGGMGGVGGAGEGGEKGIFRIFNEQMAGQISWLIPIAILGAVALLFRVKNKEEKDKKSVLRYLLLWTGWFIPMYGYFSIAGFFHRYYLSMLSPSIAALTGIGVIEMWKAYNGEGAKRFLLPAALASDAVLQGIMISRYPDWSSVLIPIACGVNFITVIILIIMIVVKKEKFIKYMKVVATVGFSVLLLAPSVWAYTPIRYGSQTTLPYAGPELNRNYNASKNSNGANRGFGFNFPNFNDMSDMVRGNSREGMVSSKLISFLKKNRNGAKYLVAVPNATSAAQIILKTGDAVMASGGFLGSDPILTPGKLEKMVKKGEIRYYLVEGMGMGGGSQSKVNNWIIKHGKIVSSSKWSDNASRSTTFNTGFGGRGMMGNGVLYDLLPGKGK